MKRNAATMSATSHRLSAAKADATSGARWAARLLARYTAMNWVSAPASQRTRRRRISVHAAMAQPGQKRATPLSARVSQNAMQSARQTAKASAISQTGTARVADRGGGKSRVIAKY